MCNEDTGGRLRAMTSGNVPEVMAGRLAGREDKKEQIITRFLNVRIVKSHSKENDTRVSSEKREF